jgi:uncharacterized SAM-binding protein YcdF (DUF218 family)
VARQASSKARWRWTAILARVVALLALLWAAGLAWFVLAQPGPAPMTQATDVVVVLTGGPGRSARGVEVLAEGSAKALFVSGVNPAVTRGEFRAAANLPPELLACCVELGKEAETTRGNALEVAAFVERRRARSIRLVTAGYHMRRAQAELAATLPPDILLVADAVAVPLSPRGMIGEYHKLIAAHALLLTGIAR